MRRVDPPTFWNCQHAASAAEFALILPIFLLFFFGIIDSGRLLYEVNQGGKAAQVAARVAIVTDPVLPELSQSYVGQSVSGGVTLIQGDRIPQDALGHVSCTDGACICVEGTCPGTGYNATAFGRILTRTQQIMPSVEASNLTVEYRGSGLGFAGNPNGLDIFPLVTVTISGVTFSPALLFGGEINLPDFTYTLTMEDGQGSGFN